MNSIVLSILKHGAVRRRAILQCKAGERRIYAPFCGLCVPGSGAPSVHAHKVDMSCAYPRGGMRPNPPHWQYRRAHWEASWSQQEGHLSASLFTPPLRPARGVPCVRAYTKPSWNSRALGLGGGAVGVLKGAGLSTISIHGKFQEPRHGAKYRDLDSVPVLSCPV